MRKRLYLAKFKMKIISHVGKKNSFILFYFIFLFLSSMNKLISREEESTVNDMPQKQTNKLKKKGKNTVFSFGRDTYYLSDR